MFNANIFFTKIIIFKMKLYFKIIIAQMLKNSIDKTGKEVRNIAIKIAKLFFLLHKSFNKNSYVH